MKKLLVILLSMLPIMACAQNFDGDWTGSWYSSYAKMKVPVKIHIAGGLCSEELTMRSSSSNNEKLLTIEEGEDGTISLYEQTAGNALKFKGKLIKGKLQGEYYVSGKPYKVTLSKTGEGKVSTPDAYKINRSSGIVVY